MGNDQSSAAAGSASPKLSSYLNQKAKEGAARQRALHVEDVVANPGGIVTVHPGLANDGDFDDPDKDADLLRLKDIPRFYPIFRNALNIPGVKDPPDIYSKFDHLPITGICQRLTDHLAAACQLTSIEQNRLINRCRDTDVMIASLTNMLADRQKKYARFAHELGKVRELNAALKKIDTQLPELVASIQSINDFLPEDIRLDPLDLSQYCDPASTSGSMVSSGDHADSSSTLSVTTSGGDAESSCSASLVSGSADASPSPARHLPSTCSNSARSTPSAIRSAMHVRASAAGALGRHRSSESGCANEADVGTGGVLVLPDTFPASLQQRVIDLSLHSNNEDDSCCGEDGETPSDPYGPGGRVIVRDDEDYADDDEVMVDQTPAVDNDIKIPTRSHVGKGYSKCGQLVVVNKNLAGVTISNTTTGKSSTSTKHTVKNVTSSGTSSKHKSHPPSMKTNSNN